MRIQTQSTSILDANTHLYIDAYIHKTTEQSFLNQNNLGFAFVPFIG